MSENKSKNENIIFRVVAGVLVISLFVFFPSGGSGTGKGRGRDSSSGDVHGAWAYMQIFVEKRLKAPGSAEFPFGGYRHVTELGGGRYSVKSYVDSENSFGAKIRTRFEGVVKRVSGGWELESLRFK